MDFIVYWNTRFFTIRTNLSEEFSKRYHRWRSAEDKRGERYANGGHVRNIAGDVRLLSENCPRRLLLAHPRQLESAQENMSRTTGRRNRWSRGREPFGLNGRRRYRRGSPEELLGLVSRHREHFDAAGR